MRLNRAITVTMLLGLASTTGCTPHRAVSGPPSVPAISVRMIEYSFLFDHRRFSAGRATFQIKNSGKLSHNLALYIVPDDAPNVASQIAANDFGNDVEQAVIFSRPPGATGTFAVDLVSGRRYVFLCRFRDSDGSPHYAKGMAAEFQVS